MSRTSQAGASPPRAALPSMLGATLTALLALALIITVPAARAAAGDYRYQTKWGAAGNQ